MDDANLEKLVIKPGKLKPKFNRNTTEYELVLNSGITQLSLDPLTRDCNASWTITGRGTERAIKFVEGSTFELCIEVTAENGTTIKTYTIFVTSLAANSTYISSLKLKSHPITPAFKQGVLKYESLVPSSCSHVEVLAIAPDKNTKIDTQPLDKESGEGKIKLNFGKTLVLVTVTSPDGTVSLCYDIVIRRDVFLFPLELKSTDSTKYKCGVCLQVVHCAVNVTGQAFCQTCLQTVTRVNKRHPLTNRQIRMEDDVVPSQQDEECKISDVVVSCVCGDGIAMGDLVTHLRSQDGCSKRLCVDEKTGIVVVKGDENTLETEACSSCSRAYFKTEKGFHDALICSAKHTSHYKLNHKLDGSLKWENKLLDEMVCQQHASDNPMDEAFKLEQEIKELFNKKPIDRKIVDLLHQTCQYYAHEINSNQKNHQAHFKLGVMLEYLYLMEDAFQLKIKNETPKHPDLDNNDEGEFQTDESMQDDIRALAEMRGYGRNATTTQQLQALDQEYHQLLEQGQSEKADYVQKLYAFKQRQQHVAGKPKHLLLQDQSNLHKALQKYQDACTLDANGSLYHVAAGRLLLMMGRMDDALARLRCAVSLKPTHPEARFLLGIAMATIGTYKKDYGNEIKTFLTQCVNAILQKQITSSPTNAIDELKNTLYLDGISSLTNMSDGGFWDSSFLLRLIVGQAFLNMSLITNRGGRTFKKNQSVYLQGHLEYGLWWKKSGRDAINKKSLRTFWKNLSNLTIVFCGNESIEILNIQKKICEELVILLPRSSEALSNYATVLSSIRELSPQQGVKLGGDIESLFRASLEVEGSDMHKQDPTPRHLIETEFWKDLNSSSTGNKTINTNKGTVATSKGAVPTKPAASTQSNVPTNKAPIAKNQGKQTKGPSGKTNGPSPSNRTSPGKATTSSKPAATGGAVSSKIPPKKPTAPATRTSTMKASGISKPLATATRSKTDVRKKSSDKCCVGKTSSTGAAKIVSTTSKGTATTIREHVEPPEESEINQPNPQARLGLARLLKQKQQDSKDARNCETTKTEIEKLYHEVIKMAPSLHDAYIELGELLAPTKPLDAIDIYCQFPFAGPDTTATTNNSEEQNGGFDDGYLYGEIVRLLMRQEKFDDPRLQHYMIKLGQILGFTTLDRYVSILENKLKYNKLLCEVYAGVNKKSVDDPELKQFFRFKCWQ